MNSAHWIATLFHNVIWNAQKLVQRVQVILGFLVYIMTETILYDIMSESC